MQGDRTICNRAVTKPPYDFRISGHRAGYIIIIYRLLLHGNVQPAENIPHSSVTKARAAEAVRARDAVENTPFSVGMARCVLRTPAEAPPPSLRRVMERERKP